MLPAPGMFSGTIVGLARDMLADVAGEEPHIEIVAGADAVADEHPHPLVLVEALD